MAQVIATLAAATTKGEYGSVPVINAYSSSTEEVVSSGTSQQLSITAFRDAVCAIYNGGETVLWVAFGASPTAVVGAGHFVPPLSVREFGGLQQGHHIAVVDDA